MVVGLVGCGRWGVNILRDLRALGCEVSVVARSEATAERARAGGATVVVPSVEALAGVEGIVVSTPTSTHADVVEAALALGVPVFVEKPLCDDASRAASLAELGGDRLFVMDKWRYHPGVLELAAIARSERLGRVHGLSTTRAGWGTRHDDVDSAWVLAPHDLAIALEILGRVPRPERAVGFTAGSGVVHLEAALDAGDAWHTLVVSSRAAEYRRTVTLLCAEGTASLGGGWDSHVTILRAGAESSDGERIETPGELPLLAELRAFVEHLGGGPPPRSSALDGAEIVAVVEQLRNLVLRP